MVFSFPLPLVFPKSLSITITLRIQAWAGPGNVSARKLCCCGTAVAGSSCRRQQRRVRVSVLEIRHRQTPAVVTGVHLTFLRHKNKLVSYETHRRDKPICGDFQRLLTTERRLAWSPSSRIYWWLERSVFETSDICYEFTQFICVLISVKICKAYKIHHHFFSDLKRIFGQNRQWKNTQLYGEGSSWGSSGDAVRTQDFFFISFYCATSLITDCKYT